MEKLDGMLDGMRMVAKWVDSEVAPVAQINPIEKLTNLLPLVDLPLITETSIGHFMCENHVIITNQDCRLFPPTFWYYASIEMMNFPLFIFQTGRD